MLEEESGVAPICLMEAIIQGDDTTFILKQWGHTQLLSGAPGNPTEAATERALAGTSLSLLVS